MDILEFAKAELAAIDNADEMQQAANSDILEILETFYKQDHSGATANYVLAVFDRLVKWKPLTPLTGEDDEWEEKENGAFQNKRCPSVFRGKDGKCVDHGAIIVSDDGGYTWYFSNNFVKDDVVFPYDVPTAPERVFIQYIGEDQFETISESPERITKLFEETLAENLSTNYGGKQ